MESSKQEVLDSLKFLFEKAEKENLWFYTKSHNLWFSPDDLKQRQENDEYVWMVHYWRLRNPHEKLDELYMEEESIQNQIWSLKRKLNIQ